MKLGVIFGILCEIIVKSCAQGRVAPPCALQADVNSNNLEGEVPWLVTKNIFAPPVYQFLSPTKTIIPHLQHARDPQNLGQTYLLT